MSNINANVNANVNANANNEYKQIDSKCIDSCIIEKVRTDISIYFVLRSLDISLKIDIKNYSSLNSCSNNKSIIEYNSKKYCIQDELLFKIISSSDVSLCDKEYKMTSKTYLKCLTDCCINIGAIWEEFLFKCTMITTYDKNINNKHIHITYTYEDTFLN